MELGCRLDFSTIGDRAGERGKNYILPFGWNNPDAWEIRNIRVFAATVDFTPPNIQRAVENAVI
jgi:hypothetical protein